MQHTPEIGPAIKRERKARKLTLEQLGTLSGVSKSMLSQIERGEANPTFAVLWSLTQAMEIELSDLIGNGTSVAGREEIEVTSVMACSPDLRPGVSFESGYFQALEWRQGHGTERQVDRGDHRRTS